MIAWLRAAFAALFTFATAVGPTHAGNETGTNNLPVPRFVSTKADRVNVRGGPDKDHQVSFIFTRVGWPVEITAQYSNWRRIRDWDGSEGWVYHSLLSSKRTAVVKLKDKSDLASLRSEPDAKSPVVARLEVGVLGTVKSCNGAWCHLAGKNFDGWIEQYDLWGVYPNEKID